MSTARETRKKNVRSSSAKESNGISLGFKELEEKGKAIVSTKVEGVKIDGKPLLIYYRRLSLGELKDDYSNLDELKGGERLDTLIDLIDGHLVNEDGSKYCDTEQLSDLPIDWTNAIAFAIIRGSTIEDEKNV